MTRKQFINQLSYHLTQLSAEERREIISFYEDRFNNAVYEGKTDEHIIAELETPEQIARNVLFEYGIEKRVQERRVEPASIIGLVFFDLFISSWLIPVLVTVSGAITMSWFSYFTVFGSFFKYGFGTGLATFLITTAVFAVYLVFIVYFVALSVKLVLSIFTWHVRVFTGDRHAPLAVQLDSFSLFEQLAKVKLTHKVFGIIAIAGIVIAAGGTSIWRATAKPVEATEGILEVYEYDVTSLDNYTLDVSLSNAAVDVEIGTTDQVVIRHQNNSEAEVVYTELSNGLQIVDMSKNNLWDNVTGIDFFIQFMNRDFDFTPDTMTILIPEDMTFTKLEIATANGMIEVEGMEATVLDIETVNGTITITETTADTINSLTTNGETELMDVFAKQVFIEGVNGEINIEDLNTPDNDGDKLVVTLVNGEITITDAYVKDVTVDNVNGNIDYHNSDHSYVADRIDLETVNGSESSNVAH